MEHGYGVWYGMVFIAHNSEIVCLYVYYTGRDLDSYCLTGSILN